MGAPIPLSIKIAVLGEWLRGLTRKSIAQRNKISEGTVSNIIQKARDDDPDIFLMRELAVMLKKNYLDLNNFASTVRLKKVLERIALAEEKLETLLEEINIHCFREGTNERDFISKIDEVFDISAELNTSIWGINSQIEKKKLEIKKLDKETADKQEELRKVFENYGTTVEELEEYKLRSKDNKITKN